MNNKIKFKQIEGLTEALTGLSGATVSLSELEAITDQVDSAVFITGSQNISGTKIFKDSSQFNAIVVSGSDNLSSLKFQNYVDDSLASNVEGLFRPYSFQFSFDEGIFGAACLQSSSNNFKSPFYYRKYGSVIDGGTAYIDFGRRMLISSENPSSSDSDLYNNGIKLDWRGNLLTGGNWRVQEPSSRSDISTKYYTDNQSNKIAEFKYPLDTPSSNGATAIQIGSSDKMYVYAFDGTTSEKIFANFYNGLNFDENGIKVSINVASNGTAGNVEFSGRLAPLTGVLLLDIALDSTDSYYGEYFSIQGAIGAGEFKNLYTIALGSQIANLKTGEPFRLELLRAVNGNDNISNDVFFSNGLLQNSNYNS